MVAPSIAWAPQAGPQKAFIKCPVPEIFFGGARGGSKTDGVLGKYAIKGEKYGPHFNSIFFRKELPMCDDAIERSYEIFGKLGWKYNSSKYSWRSQAGARLRFRPLERVTDADKYQGQNVTDATVEEAGNFPESRPIDRLNGILRSAHGVPTQLCLTGNPGGPGQLWIKARYIDPAPNGMEILERKLPNGDVHKYVFIPSKLKDNKILMTKDPGYVNRLYMVGSTALVKAWLEGDWNAIEGAYFDCWGDRHVIEPFDIPEWWIRFSSFDWGSAAPFSHGWWAVSDGSELRDGRCYPAGAIIRYREWYGANVSEEGISGLKMANEDIAKGILGRETLEERKMIKYRIADPSIFKVEGGPSIAEQIARAGVTFHKGDNRRVPRNGPISGWAQMRDRLLGDDWPMIYTFNACVDSIRTIPMLQHDETNPEDVDTDGEDHAGDEWRYACMSRPYFRTKAPPPDDITRTPTFDEACAAADKMNQRWGRI